MSATDPLFVVGALGAAAVLARRARTNVLPMTKTAQLIEAQATRTVPEVSILSDEGAALLDAGAVARAVGEVGQFSFTEGPVWVPAHGAWIFSDIPASEQYSWTLPPAGAEAAGAAAAAGELRLFRKPSANANGNFLDNEGRLLTCEHETRLLTRTVLPPPPPPPPPQQQQQQQQQQRLSGALADGAQRSVVADACGAKSLTSPNDVVVSRRTGAVYFTDPTYGTLAALGHGNACEQARNAVYRLDPASGGQLAALKLTGAAGQPPQPSFLQPNGLCFGPGETQLYVADSGAYNPPDCVYTPTDPHHVRVFDLVEGGTALANGRIFCTTPEGAGVPDGIRCDARGNLWVAVATGVDVYSSGGELIAQILTPKTVANCAFGGPDGTDLMMCSCTSVWIMPTKVQGSGDIVRPA